jgi:cytochrome c oxidase cbb3-type subunit III
MWRPLLVISTLVLTGAAIAHWRGETNYRSSPAADAARGDHTTLTKLYAGGQPQQSTDANTHYELSGFDVNEGKRLYKWFNCNGCHANGGGDIGPALMDDKWIYGAEPRNVYETIMQGRPNGMPSFRSKITDSQAWQIVAYVRSMSGLVPFYARPGRNDDLQAKPPESMTWQQQPKAGGLPPSDPRSSQ